MVQSFNSLLVAIPFFVSIFTPIVATYALCSTAIISEYVARAMGVLLLRKIEQNRKRMRSRSSTLTTTTTRTTVDAGELENGLGNFLEISFEKARKEYKYPAVNIEHHVDRLGAFVTIVLGEMVVNIFFHTNLASGLSEYVSFVVPVSLN
jgi:hypothetical protein